MLVAWLLRAGNGCLACLQRGSAFSVLVVAAVAMVVVTLVDPAVGATAQSSKLVQLTSPSRATFTRQYVMVQAHLAGGAHGVELEFRTSDKHAWSPIPERTLATSSGARVALPLEADARGDTLLLRWDMPATTSNERGVAAENSIGARDGVIFIRAVARSGQGAVLASEAGAVVLTRAGPGPTDPEAPTIYDGVAFAGGPPIHVTWEASSSVLSLPDHSYVEVPMAGYAVDVVRKGSGRLPQAKVTTRETSYDVPVPPVGREPYVIVVRPIDEAGNVGEPHVTPEFRSEAVPLTSPRQDAIVTGAEPVLLRAPSTKPVSVCFQYREANATVADGASPPNWRPIPASEVTDAAGSPIRRWPVTTTRTSGPLRWRGLAHAHSVNGLPGREVEIRVAVTRANTRCVAAGGAARGHVVHWSLKPGTYNLDPAAPDPHDHDWGAGLPSALGAPNGSGGINGAMYYGAAAQRCQQGCRVATTDYAGATADLVQRRSESLTEIRASNDGGTTATVSGCARKIDVAGKYEMTVTAKGPIVGARGASGGTLDGALELSPTGGLIAYVVGRNCRSHGGTVAIQDVDSNSSDSGREFRACVGTCSYPAFPDAQHLAWIDSHRNLRLANVYDVEKHGAAAHSAIIKTDVRAATWSHDGKIVAIDDGSSKTLLLYSRNGAAGFDRAKPSYSTTRLRFAHTDITGPIAPDSAHMLVTLYLGKHHDRPVLAVRNLHSGVVKTLQSTFRLADATTHKDVALDFSTPRAFNALMHPEDWAGFPF